MRWVEQDGGRDGYRFNESSGDVICSSSTPDLSLTTSIAGTHRGSPLLSPHSFTSISASPFAE